MSVFLDTTRVARLAAKARQRLQELSPEAVQKIDASLDIDFEEHFRLQTIKSRWHVEERLTDEDAQAIYIALGEVGSSENGGWAAEADTATKYAVMLIVEQLLTQDVNRVLRGRRS